MQINPDGSLKVRNFKKRCRRNPQGRHTSTSFVVRGNFVRLISVKDEPHFRLERSRKHKKLSFYTISKT